MVKPSRDRIVLLVLLGLALALRWRHVLEISFFVDEFVTVWAARGVWLHGLPGFPSGNLYPHGFLFSYLEAPFVLGSFDETLARIPALIVSLATVPLAYWIGRRFFSAPVGLIAAAALAVDPDCIIWGGRARMYGLLQLLTLLIVYFAYQGLARDRARDRYLAMGLVVAAIFTHAEAILLLPVLAMTAFVVWPWRRLMRPSVVLPFALSCLGALAFFLVSRLGQPAHLEAVQQIRPYLVFQLNLPGNLQAFAPFFIHPYRLPFALLAVAGLFPLLRPRRGVGGVGQATEGSPGAQAEWATEGSPGAQAEWATEGSPGAQAEWGHSPLTYLYTVLILFLAAFLLLAGATWQNDRYLFLLLPILFLIGGQVLNAAVDWAAGAVSRPAGLKRFSQWRGTALALPVVLLVGLAGISTAYAQEPGYDLAFRYLRDRWQPQAGEQVVTFSPAAAMLYLGQCDYYAIQRGYEEYIIARPDDGRPADLWTATPLLSTTAGLVDLLATAPRVWFVVDEWRFETRYEPDFRQSVLDRMDLEYHQREVMIFRSRGDMALESP